jgi:6-hydroxycyclohex-1-ene-1-carbonyl-CoA dehydrogenase
MSIEGYAWALETPKKPLVRVSRTWGEPRKGFALLEVLGCGVCHTDLGFADGDVAPRAPLPLVLGHEVAGRVVSVGPFVPPTLVGRRVLAPAVSPCGHCSACAAGRPTACPHGRMPGNDGDGGFATHVEVPAADLVPLESEAGTGPLGHARLEAWEIAPIADAGTTAWQAIVRARLAAGELAIFVGAGGVGGFGVQLARSIGAHVIAVDVSHARLSSLDGFADALVDVKGLDSRGAREAVRAVVKAHGWSKQTVRVFETSGTVPGQETAFELVGRGGSLSIVGYTRERASVRLSNLMALDAEVFGNWGCDPALYADVIARVLEGRVAVRPFVEKRSMTDANEVLADVRAHAVSKRVVLVPDGAGG